MKICKFVMPEVIFGPGSLGQIAECAQRLGAEKVFLVTDEGLRRAGWVDKAVAILREWGMDFELWSEVTPN
ncbi:MAG: iron-containing alcohol dehydrogenase, partial [Anaerolineae bacterium]